MTNKLARLRALSWPERQVLLQATLLLPFFWAGLRLLGFQRLHSWVVRQVARVANGHDIEPASIGTLVSIAGNHHPLPSTCLTRSLLLVWLLGRRGLSGKLRIGVRTIDSGIDAHAWVELEGKPLNDAPGVSGQFAVFDLP